MKRKLLVLMIAFAMILSFSACGGGGESAPAEPAEETAETAAEPNAGVTGIVVTLPEGWELSSFSENSSSVYTKAGSPLQFGISAFTQADVDSMKDSSFKTVQDFYDKYYKITEENLKKHNIQLENIKVCDCDAEYIKRPHDKDDFSVLSTSFICDDAIYEIYLTSPNAIEWNSGGKISDSAPVLSDEEIAMYEAVLASAQKGDGNAIQKEQLASFTVDSIGSVSFEAPAGFYPKSVSDNYITFGKDGSDAEFYFNVTHPEDLQNITLEDGSHPSSIKDYYNSNYFFEGMEKEEIAGFDGFVNKYPDEDGSYYNVGGGFLADDGIYDFTLDANAYDWENDGALKEGAQPLTEDDIAAFDAFVASIKKK